MVRRGRMRQRSAPTRARDGRLLTPRSGDRCLDRGRCRRHQREVNSCYRATEGDRDVVEPDLVFVRTERLDIIGPAAILGPPDLVVEIPSPSTWQGDPRLKRALYERHGVREYCIVDPESRTMATNLLERWTYTSATPSEGGKRHSAVLPGLIIDPAALLVAAGLPSRSDGAHAERCRSCRWSRPSRHRSALKVLRGPSAAAMSCPVDHDAAPMPPAKSSDRIIPIGNARP